MTGDNDDYGLNRFFKSGLVRSSLKMEPHRLQWYGRYNVGQFFDMDTGHYALQHVSRTTLILNEQCFNIYLVVLAYVYTFICLTDISRAEDDNKSPRDTYKAPVNVYPDGKVVWYVPVVWKSSCTVDITWFPVDTQVFQSSYLYGHIFQINIFTFFLFQVQITFMTYHHAP